MTPTAEAAQAAGSRLVHTDPTVNDRPDRGTEFHIPAVGFLDGGAIPAGGRLLRRRNTSGGWRQQ